MFIEQDEIKHYLIIYDDEFFLEAFDYEQQLLILQNTACRTITKFIYDIIINEGCIYIHSLEYINYIDGIDKESILKLIPENAFFDRSSVYVVNRADIDYLVRDINISISFSLDTIGYNKNIFNGYFYEYFYKTIMEVGIMDQYQYNLTIDDFDGVYKPIARCFIKILEQIDHIVNYKDYLDLNDIYVPLFINYNRGKLIFNIFYK
jgi:hypothetical protein